MRNNVLFSKRLVEMVVYFCNSLSEIKGDLSERDSDLHHIYCPRWLIFCFVQHLVDSNVSLFLIV